MQRQLQALPLVVLLVMLVTLLVFLPQKLLAAVPREPVPRIPPTHDSIGAGDTTPPYLTLALLTRLGVVRQLHDPALHADTAVTWVEVLPKRGTPRDGQLPHLIVAEMAIARARGRTPFLEVGATWCGSCRALEAALHTPEMIDAFAGTYIIHLDPDEWDVNDDMGPLGFPGGVMTLPMIAALDSTGKVTHVLMGEIEAATIKRFLQANLWRSSGQKAATRPIAHSSS